MASEEHETRSAVERASQLSDDVIQALEDDFRGASEAVSRFLVTVEEALPQVEGARTAEKRITESALKMAQQLVHAQSQFLQKVIDSAGESLSRSEAEK
jgi:vacuolar-type H+-ATPase subunit E/Vma4